MPSLRALRQLMTALFAALAIAVVPTHAEDAQPAIAKPTAFLGVVFKNDNEGLDPTSDAERARIVSLEKQFKDELSKSGAFKFVVVSPELSSKIKAGQTLGSCSGCEAVYGKEAGSTHVAWVEVQKISNLIMNMNVYIAEVASQKLLYIHSVDVRGNTNESWSRSMKYMLENYPPKL